MLDKITSLNEKIDSLMQKKVKLDAKREMLTEKLNEGLSEYLKTYGVELKGNTFNETVENINKEVNEVESKVTEEYELAKKVVSCIEEGNISEANKLLGIEDSAEGELVQEEDIATSAAVDIDGDEEQEEELAISTVNMTGVEEVTNSIDEDPDAESSMVFKGMVVEEDDDDDFGFGDILSGGKFDLEED